MAVRLADTGTVVILNVAVEPNPGIWTDEGTVTDGLLLERSIVAPPTGAISVNVTVPTDPWPPVTEVGSTVTVKVIGLTVKLDCSVAGPRVASIVTIVCTVTITVSTWNDAFVEPDGI